MTDPTPARSEPALTPEAARLEIAKLEGDPVSIAALTDKGSIAHADLTARRNALYAAAYPEPGQEATATPPGKAADPGAAPAPAASAADLAEALLPAQEGQAPADERGMAISDHNRVHLAAALSELGATKDEVARLGRAFAGMRGHGLTFTAEQGAALMRDEWGDQYDANLATAEAALESLGDDDLKSWLIATGLANNLLIVRTLFDLGRRRGL